jgi:competence protein ComEC
MQAANPSTTGRLWEYLTTQLPLVWFSLAFLGGTVFASLISLDVLVWIALVVVSLLLIVLSRVLAPRFAALPSFLSPFLFVLLLAFFLGAARYQMSVPRVNAFHIAFYNDRGHDLLVTGTVVEPPDYRDTYTNLRIEVTAVDTGDGNLPVNGLVLARVSTNQFFQYGNIVRLRGVLQSPLEIEEFSYRDDLAAQHIHSYMTSADVTVLPGSGGNPVSAALYEFKDRGLANVYRLFPDPESSVMAGSVFGVDSGLTQELQDAFKNTGTAHTVAISAFNITVIAGLFMTFFSRSLGTQRGALLAIIGIAFYTILVGGDGAVIRAAIMASLALFARQVGGRQAALNTLLAVALFICLWNPLYLGDVSFQLSFFATLGLILYAEPFSRFADGIITRYVPAGSARRLALFVSRFVLLTLAAQVMTIPIMAYHFQRISLVWFLASPFLLPAQPVVMILGGLAVVLSLIWFPLGQIAGWVSWPFVVYTVRLVEIFDRLPHGTILLGDLSSWFVVILYAVLLVVTLGGHRTKEWVQTMRRDRLRVPAWTGIVVLLLALLLVWRAASALPDEYLHVTFLDVGSADAVLIKTPTGKHVLINGGPSVTTLSDELGRRLPAFNRKLDWLIVAGTQEEEVAALPRVIQRYPPDVVLWSGNTQASFSSRVLNEYLSVSGIPVVTAEAEHVLDLGDGAILRVLTVGPRGAVLLVEWKNFRALLPVGISFEALDELRQGASIGPVSVLSLADSGYAASNPPEWIANLNPEIIVLSVAAADPNGMPDSEVLEIIQDYGVLRTDRNGWVEITTNGERMWVNVERR